MRERRGREVRERGSARGGDPGKFNMKSERVEREEMEGGGRRELSEWEGESPGREKDKRGWSEEERCKKNYMRPPLYKRYIPGFQDLDSPGHIS